MSVPESRRYATTRPKLAARRARRHRATRARTLAARIRVESARANVFTMMASSLGSSLAPVAGAPRARRGPRASRATSSTASDSSSRLDALLGEDLGDAVRTSLRRRDTAAAIDAAVASLERDSPTDHPVASPLLDGDWKLRYPTSAGTVGSVGAWETFVGAVFDVRQTCARRPDGAGVAIINVVTVRVPAPPAPPMPFPTIPIPDRPVAVRITQTFAAEATSRRRLETKLRESVVDVLRGNADDDESDASVRVPDESDASVRVPDAFGGIFAAPIESPRRRRRRWRTVSARARRRAKSRHRSPNPGRTRNRPRDNKSRTSPNGGASRATTRRIPSTRVFRRDRENHPPPRRRRDTTRRRRSR